MFISHFNFYFYLGEVKTLMIQLLRAVVHLHDNWILHRDLKASNLLLSNKGILKVCFIDEITMYRKELYFGRKLYLTPGGDKAVPVETLLKLLSALPL